MKYAVSETQAVDITVDYCGRKGWLSVCWHGEGEAEGKLLSEMFQSYVNNSIEILIMNISNHYSLRGIT